jgi:hypothetical protein
MDLAHRGRVHRAADVRPALRVAVVSPSDPVVDQVTGTAATRPAQAQLAVEAVQGLAVQLADLQLAQGRTEVVGDVPAIGAGRGRLDVEHLEVAVEETVDRGLRPGVATLVDLGQELGPDLLGGGRGVRHVDQVVPLAGQRVGAGEDPNAVGAARQTVYGTPSTAGGFGGHDTSLRPARVMIGVTTEPEW